MKQCRGETLKSVPPGEAQHVHRFVYERVRELIAPSGSVGVHRQDPRGLEISWAAYEAGDVRQAPLRREDRVDGDRLTVDLGDQLGIERPCVAVFGVVATAKECPASPFLTWYFASIGSPASRRSSLLMSLLASLRFADRRGAPVVVAPVGDLDLLELELPQPAAMSDPSASTTAKRRRLGDAMNRTER